MNIELVINITIEQLYRNLIESSIDPILDSKGNDRVLAHKHIANYTLGIIQLDAAIIKDAFKKGCTASLLSVEQMTQLDEVAKLEKNFQINVFSDEKLFLSVVNEEVVW